MRRRLIAFMACVAVLRFTGVGAQSCSFYDFRMSDRTGTNFGLAGAAELLSWSGGTKAECERLRGRIFERLRQDASEADKALSKARGDAVMSIGIGAKSGDYERARRDVNAAEKRAREAQKQVDGFPRSCTCVLDTPVSPNVKSPEPSSREPVSRQPSERTASGKTSTTQAATSPGTKEATSRTPPPAPTPQPRQTYVPGPPPIIVDSSQLSKDEERRRQQAKEKQDAENAKNAQAVADAISNPFGNSQERPAITAENASLADPFASAKGVGGRGGIPSQNRLSDILGQRLTLLGQLHRETEESFDANDRELEREHGELERRIRTQDVVTDVATVLIGLTKLTAKTYDAMKLTGKALDAESEKLAKEVVKDAYKDLLNRSAGAWGESLKPQDSLQWAFGAIVAKSVSDMQTPTFWAGVASELQSGRSWADAVNRRPEDTLREAKARNAALRQKTLSALEARIAETERMLRDAQAASRR